MVLSKNFQGKYHILLKNLWLRDYRENIASPFCVGLMFTFPLPNQSFVQFENIDFLHFVFTIIVLELNCVNFKILCIENLYSDYRFLVDSARGIVKRLIDSTAWNYNFDQTICFRCVTQLQSVFILFLNQEICALLIQTRQD